ncbi:DUF2750 domain-containing protein [Pontibacter vulgaris]|uniref:DUF2750 domain-containing protein n=1 Tax=Pontibacter vulgaris TaxID=2905679 RepID=UPI001FA6D5D6|nr:DUF2750 domain-containing protein [Pontibacter vulgaris]
MQQNGESNEATYKKFIERVVASDAVWGLSEGDIWATSSSNEFDDTEVILFWSSEAGAMACAEDEWDGYKAEQVPLVEFLENWCVGMYGDHLLAGLDWDAALSGKETEPLEAALDVINELKAQKKLVLFTNYDSLEDYESQIIEALNSDEEEEEA